MQFDAKPVLDRHLQHQPLRAATVILLTMMALLLATPAPATAQPKPAQDSCNVDPAAPGKKIYYGTEAPTETSTVGITFSQDGYTNICTGVVIAPNAVLTAGHCSCGKDYKLIFGEKMHDDDVVTTTPRVDRHPGYKCKWQDRVQPGVDYALLTFDPSQLPLDPQHNPIYTVASIMSPRAAQKSVLDPPSRLRVVGYGKTQNNKTGSRFQADVPVMTWDCAERWSNGRGCKSFDEIILSEVGLGFRPDGENKDTCGGDSGGPAFAISSESDACKNPLKRSYLIAITSRGMELRNTEIGNRPCGGGGIYEVVARTSVLNWLSDLGVSPVIHKEPTAADGR